jgi:iron complex transport system substrate-binding protein
MANPLHKCISKVRLNQGKESILGNLSIEMRIVQLLSLMMMFMTVGCRQEKSNTVHDHPAGYSPVSVRFARGFSLEDNGSYKSVTIRNPWQNAKNISYTYYLLTGDSLPQYDDRERYIRVPVKRVICLSTTHIGFIEYIEELGSIVGLSGSRYVSNPYLVDQIRKGGIFDVGYDEGINYELILKLKPDLVIAYGISGNETGFSEKLKELGVRVMFVAEYLEADVLARMEWVKVFAALYHKENEISVRFDSAVIRYHSLAGKVSGLKKKPTVLLGLPWKGTWYVSGGKSHTAQLISDAGGDYLWKNLSFSDSKPMNLETIFGKAFEAEFWLNTGDASSIKEILDVDQRFGSLSCIRNGRVYNCNNLVNPRGGNEYFEKGVVEPDIVLADLIAILHPEALPSHQLKYYKKLK